MDKIYDMKLHEELTPQFSDAPVAVTRVPGGWVYTFYSANETGGHDMSSCFVPFCTEFAQTSP